MTLVSTLLFCTLQLFCSSEPPHSNVVGELKIDHFKEEVFLEAILDKRYLTAALRSKSGCPPKEMLSICGNNYFTSHVRISLNGEEAIFKKQNMDVQKDFVVFKYALGSVKGSIHEITVESDYMQDFHDHSVVAVTLEIYDLTRSYSLTHSKPELTLNL